jgi:hypothetical protein
MRGGDRRRRRQAAGRVRASPGRHARIPKPRILLQTPLAQSRIHEAAPEQARIGAAAYVRGQAGNDYTRALLAAYGRYQPGNGRPAGRSPLRVPRWPPTAGTSPATASRKVPSVATYGRCQPARACRTGPAIAPRRGRRERYCRVLTLGRICGMSKFGGSAQAGTMYGRVGG